MDLSSLESVRKCAAILLERYDHINILINNAGVSIPTKMGIKTTEGYEINFGVNHLGHFLLTNLLVDRLIASAPSRYSYLNKNKSKGIILLNVYKNYPEL